MPTPTLDIELPLVSARSRDAPIAARTRPSPLDRSRPPTHAALAKVLASASVGHYGLAVDVRDDNRVVGTWHIELHPRDAGGALICNTRARLQVCASACGKARSNSAFLVVAQWPTNVSDTRQRSELYRQLCQAVLARLESIAGRLPAAARMPPYVLFLIDGRPRSDRQQESLNLARVQSELLRELEGSAVGRQLDLQVAHGRGTGSSPLLPTPAAPAGVDLSAAAQFIWPSRAMLAEPKHLPQLGTTAHFDLESLSEAEKRHAGPTDWKTASSLAD